MVPPVPACCPLTSSPQHPHSFSIVRTDQQDAHAFSCDTKEQRDRWIALILDAAATAKT